MLSRSSSASAATSASTLSSTCLWRCVVADLDQVREVLAVARSDADADLDRTSPRATDREVR